MKKLLLLAIVGLAFTSCKKDWNCVCTDSNQKQTIMPITQAKKADAKAKCNEYDAQFSIAKGSCTLE